MATSMADFVDDGLPDVPAVHDSVLARITFNFTKNLLSRLPELRSKVQMLEE
jgi:hypothetical protein